MNKILIIGQAPAAVSQAVPYDTTMLYEWLAECGVSKSQAQDMFEFEAVSNAFPGFATKGHLKPTQESMESHWPVLCEKIGKATRVIILGNVAKEYLASKHFMVRVDSNALWLMHPSRRNYSKFNAKRNQIIQQLKSFIQSA